MLLSKKLINVLALIVASLVLLASFHQSQLGVEANKKSDILFLKGKFVLKDKRGSIVISDEKKPCSCGHYGYYR